MINLICAVSENGIIGITEGGISKIPWHYPEDMKFFREQTKNSTVIMGRATYQSIGKALPNRRNIVISKKRKNIESLKLINDIEVFNNLEDALKTCEGDIWLIGGESIYAEGMKYADNIYLTLIPEYININYKKHAKFPWISPKIFNKQKIQTISNNLDVIIYSK